MYIVYVIYVCTYMYIFCTSKIAKSPKDRCVFCVAIFALPSVGHMCDGYKLFIHECMFARTCHLRN